MLRDKLLHGVSALPLKSGLPTTTSYEDRNASLFGCGCAALCPTAASGRFLDGAAEDHQRHVGWNKHSWCYGRWPDLGQRGQMQARIAGDHVVGTLFNRFLGCLYY